MLLFLTGPVFAAGTAANTVISNSATVDYVLGGSPGTATGNVAFTVQEILDVSVVWEDAANVPVLSPSSDRVLRFRLTNTGNGTEQFLLNADGTLGGDNFNPVPGSVRIWLDDGDNVFSPGSDTLYNGSNGPVLNGANPADDSITIFVTADIPPGLTAAAFARVGLTATSVTANNAGQTGNPGAEMVAAGDGGVNANVGLSGAVSNAVGAYQVAPTNVDIDKSVTVIDTLGGTDPHPGATLRYTLQINVGGVSIVNNLVITDVIPANTTFTPGSITLNGAPQTDTGDAPGVDYSDFNVTTPDTITVDLGQGGTQGITPPATFTIVFEVTIN
jgi:uncharacterized repeat protein (TIGR01451 family)